MAAELAGPTGSIHIEPLGIAGDHHPLRGVLPDHLGRSVMAVMS